MDALGFGVIALIVAVVLIFSMIVFMASRYKRCPSDKILVIYGRVEKGRSSKTSHGGGAFVWPLIQDYAYMSLTPMTITIPLENALSRWRERLADRYALEATGKPEAFASAMTRLANQNLADVDPEPWVELLLYSHPALSRRIAMAEAYPLSDPA